MSQTRLGYRPALDGLRAIAILMVVCVHAFAWPPSGWLGVEVFFVLSGFLITTLLLEEQEARGRVDLPAFWRRRARRLAPGLLAMLLIYTLVTATTGHLDHRAAMSVLGGLFYFANIQKALGAHITMTHLWSLGEEEQFYLLWPPIMFLALRGKRRLGLILLAVAIVFTVWSGAWNVSYSASNAVSFGVPRVFAILLGCAAAITIREWPTAASTAARWLLPLALLEITRITWAGGQRLPMVAVAATVLLVAAVNGGWITRPLSAPPLVGLGRISYSLYLWHVPVLLAFGIDPGGHVTRWAAVPAVACSLALAWLSYRFVEQPFRQHRPQPKLQPLAAT